MPLRLLLTYLAVMFALNLIWEVAQLPLFTLWGEASSGTIAFAVLHCTMGDVMIASVTLVIGWLLAGLPEWPQEHFARVAGFVLAGGVLYTIYSEWSNVYVTGAWAYSELMPTIWGIGVAPVLQWLLVPPAAFVLARRNWPSYTV